MAVSRFGPQTRCRHAAIGEFERSGDREPQQRLITNTAGFGELDSHLTRTPRRLFAAFSLVLGPEFLQRHLAAAHFAGVENALGGLADRLFGLGLRLFS
jgi:hypothetical protein